jgi:outer membrane murein-binding lipoprotein Lpp
MVTKILVIPIVIFGLLLSGCIENGTHTVNNTTASLTNTTNATVNTSERAANNTSPADNDFSLTFALEKPPDEVIGG